MPAQTMSLEECYRRHADDVRRSVANRVTGDSDAADDACAFAWMQAARYWPITPNPAGWVYVTACRFGWAQAKKRQGVPAEVLLDVADPLADPQRAAEAAEVLDALAELPANQRAALTGQSLGLSYVEIGDAAARRYSWVNRHVSEGRAALRAELGEDR